MSGRPGSRFRDARTWVLATGERSKSVASRVCNTRGFFIKSPAQWVFSGLIGFFRVFWVLLGFLENRQNFTFSYQDKGSLSQGIFEYCYDSAGNREYPPLVAKFY